MSGKKVKFLQELVNNKMNDIITVFRLESSQLHVYYLPKQPVSNVDTEKLTYFLQNEILQEIIPLPLPHERSSQLETELEKIMSEEITNNEVLIIHNALALKTKQKEITLFGYERKVIEIKKQILNIIETNILITYKLNPIDTYQIDSFIETQWKKLTDIERKYKKLGVDLRLRFNEFSAPRHLKDEIESSIQELLSQSLTTITFESMELYKDIAKKEEEHLTSIAKNNRCYIKTKLTHHHQSYAVPKASVSNKQISKSIVAQSELFISSADIFKKMIVANGSIELRTGDIALQKVDAIIISKTSNGLKEGVIERLGQIDYEITHSENDGTMYTETDGGKLNCKQILFSNWFPNSLLNNDNVLRQSIKTFVSKSIEYTTKDKGTQSIAFAVPDSCTDETILGEEMIAEAKRQLETNALPLRILFVCLPEQQALYKQFSNVIPTVQDDYAYFDWSTAIISITLMGSTMEHVTRCQGRINKYLSRCISSVKSTHSNDVFQLWDQHTINSFYKYCKDRCILPKLVEAKNELELIGPTTHILEVKKNFQILSELMKENLHCTSTIERPSSAISCAAQSENKSNIKMAKLYNIVVSYSQLDKRKCQRLINRLTEEGFSIGRDFNIVEAQRDLRSQMDKSDCILLCISENYYESLLCIEEAKYAFQTDKKIFLVKIQNNPIFGWDDDLFEGKLFFHSFGSDNYFDFEYGRLLLELLRYTKPGFSSLVQRRSSRMQQDVDEFRAILTVEQQSSIENKLVQKSSNIKQQQSQAINNSNMKLQNTIIDMAKNERKSDDQLKTATLKRELSFIEECWLRRLSNIPKPHLSLLSLHKEVYNKDELSDSYSVSNLSVQPIVSINGFSDHSIGNKTLSSGHVAHSFKEQSIKQFSVDENETYGRCTKKVQLFSGLSQVFPTDYSPIDFIPRRPTNYPYSSIYCFWSNEDSFRNEEEMEERRELDNPEKMKHIRENLAKYFIETYKCYTEEQLDTYLKFAQRMKDNAAKFETFCSITTLVK